MCLSIHAMLLMRMSPGPNTSVGRTIAHLRVDRWIADADLHELPHAGRLGRGDEDACVGDGKVKIEAAAREPHPVGVVENVDAPQRGNEPRSIVEAQRLDLYRGFNVLGARPMGVVREGADAPPVLEEPARDE